MIKKITVYKNFSDLFNETPGGSVIDDDHQLCQETPGDIQPSVSCNSSQKPRIWESSRHDPNRAVLTIGLSHSLNFEACFIGCKYGCVNMIKYERHRIQQSLVTVVSN